MQSPNFDDYAKLKQAIRYLKGADDCRLTIRIGAADSAQMTVDMATYVDSDGAGCTTTDICNRFHDHACRRGRP